MKINLSFLFFILLNQVVASASGLTTITGSAPDYASSEITFYQFSDPVSEEKVSLFTIRFDAEGNFKTTVQIENITQVFADFDSYSANIYLVPGKTYDIIFPPRKEITNSQRHNPFFKPVHVHLAVKDPVKDELNRKIREFEKSYQEAERPYFTQIYRNKSAAAVDSIRLKIKSQFPSGSNSFFEEYKFYRLAFPEYALHQGKNEDFITKYFNKTLNFNISPCKNLFNRTYSNFFLQLSNSVNGNEFRKLLGSSNISEIENYLKVKHHLNTENAQLVILRSIHDAFHQGQFSQKGLLSMLGKIQTGNWPAKHKLIAKRLEKKLTHLQVGTLAPKMSFLDFDDIKHSLSEYQDKIVYLHFTRVSNPICRQHLDALKKLPDAVKKEIKVVNLILDEEKGQQDQILKQNWLGDFFIINDKVAKSWKVKSFPTSFLIDKNGKFVYSPANNPLDGLGKQVGVFLQKKRMEELRNQAR